ncbi:hypothetical protein D6C91_03833 [Aureobasidium pullulans]|uniref:Uncharacterized protein n=1 Tax=Aureobasidium pullulans TaxID=5580 RepID=A0A4S9TDV6_AURPU|nr:hypothetical protein D6C91_03833 [Aureobasidium pullulans]
MTSSQRMAARRIAEGRDASDRSERVPPPDLSVNTPVYRNELPAQAPVVRMPTKTGPAASSAAPASVAPESAAFNSATSNPTASNSAGPEVQPEAQSASIQALIGAIQEHTAALDRNTATLDRAAGLWP